MQLVPAKCTQCGAILEVNPSQDAAICKSCKTPFIIEKAINIYNVTSINEATSGNVDSMIEYANSVIDTDTESAEKQFHEILAVHPKNSRAWKGLYECEKVKASCIPFYWGGNGGIFTFNGMEYQATIYTEYGVYRGVVGLRGTTEWEGKQAFERAGDIQGLMTYLKGIARSRIKDSCIISFSARRGLISTDKVLDELRERALSYMAKAIQYSDEECQKADYQALLESDTSQSESAIKSLYSTVNRLEECFKATRKELKGLKSVYDPDQFRRKLRTTKVNSHRCLICDSKLSFTGKCKMNPEHIQDIDLVFAEVKEQDEKRMGEIINNMFTNNINS